MLNRKQKVQECDATAAEQRCKSRLQNKSTAFKQCFVNLQPFSFTADLKNAVR